MHIQTFDPLRKSLDKLLARNPRIGLKALYHYSRQIEAVSVIGDFPLISEIVYHCAKTNKFFTAKELVKVYKLTADPFLHKLNSSSKLVVVLTDREKLKASIRAQKLKKAQSH